MSGKRFEGSQGAPSTATLGFVGALLQSAQTEDAARHPSLNREAFRSGRPEGTRQTKPRVAVLRRPLGVNYGFANNSFGNVSAKS